MKKVIGVTGGIASGKSNVLSVISDLGYPVIDSDGISHELSQKEGLVYQAMVKTFGQDYVLPSGEIDRKKLGSLIFHDETARKLLDSVSHPIIKDEIRRRLASYEEGLIFIDVPLLYEAHFEDLCDEVICVYLEEELQISRLMERDSIPREYAESKIRSQMSLDKKKDLADYVISSKGTFDETKSQVLDIIDEIKGV